VTNEIKDFFDRAAIDRDLKFTMDPLLEYEQKIRSRIVISLLDAKPNELILDVGCGSGRDLIQLVKMGCKCIGIDFSGKMIEESRKELSKNGITAVELEIGDATNLRFPDRMFDKVFASEVLEHIPNYNKAISEMARVLKPAGYLVVTTPNRRSIYGFDRYVIREKLLGRKWPHPYDSWKIFDELKSALSNNGFTIVSFTGGCYIPGSLVPRCVPKIMKKLLVTIAGASEGRLSKMFPKNGYILAIKAVKTSE
jgi:ubiquinone biosynthesis O-methyltransferase